jgi:hypothetical protein
MATIKEEESSYTTKRDITIDINWVESHYPDDSLYECTITFPVPHLADEVVDVDYSDQYESKILSQIMLDIQEYLEDPHGWAQEMIKKGVEPTLELRQLEADLAEARADQERYTRYANEKAESIMRKEQEIATHKAKHEL